VNVGLLIAFAAAAIAWWLLDRSTLGFRFRITGKSPNAARTAGIDAKRTLIAAFLVSGAFVGLAGVVQLTSTDLFLTTNGPQGYASSIGFSAITVALLGRNRPLGIVLGAILIGALVNGAYGVEAATGISTDLTTIVQAVMVLCVAAPAMVARIFRLRPGNALSLEFGGWGT
jgi:simple sugar transport system permease protein